MDEKNLENLMGANEKVLWKGKPSKKCFVLESIFNPMLPFALIWSLFDALYIGATLFSGDREMMLSVIIFMLFHMMPVWIYLGGIIFTNRKYKNTAYLITDKGIYISRGLFSYNYEMKPFTDLAHIDIHRGIFDQKLGVGDVKCICTHSLITNSNHNNEVINIFDIPDYMEVFNLIKKLQTDIYADTMYPNDMRPKTNHGYNTEYINNK